jgi:hypothetical protein
MNASMHRCATITLWVAVVAMLIVSLYRFLSHHTDHEGGE